MNQHLRPLPVPRPPTRAAEGLPRWRWTTAELEQLVALGLLVNEDGVELIGGEIVPMSPNGRRHDLVREELERALRRHESDSAHVVGEMQFNLADDTHTKPDVLVRPATIKSPDLRGGTALLVVEVADSSLQHDLTTKAALYAAHGVREYWVGEAWSLDTHVHRDPDASRSAWRSVTKVAAATPLTALLAPWMLVRLADLGV